MLTIFRRTLPLLLLPLALACVPKAKYDTLQDQYDSARSENDRLRQQIEVLRARDAARTQAFQDILKDLKPLIDKGILKVENIGGRVVIGMASDVLFASGSADLSPDGASAVAEVARALGRHAVDHDFQVEGHTDNQPIASAQFPNNWYLGAARAITVSQKMVESGFSSKHISAASFGDLHPVASNDSPDGRAKNRRIEIVLLPELSELPGAPADRSPKPAHPPKPPRGPR